MNRERKELFYQAGSSYAVETGGRLKDIREVCTLERLKKYHEKYYHLNNMNYHYITEIHHIDGDGKDAGVLYREMQPKEMDTDEIVNRERKELFY
uniref:Uncharacterized protein n=1 Tax=Meloidogyne javanica TaxID=6303 RepID=A0A915MAC7_MELJA